jgi:hypothetical protein
MKGVSPASKSPKYELKLVNFRLPAPVMRQVRIKSAQDAETLQALYETCSRAWLAGLIDPSELRAELAKHETEESAEEE